MPVQFKKMHGLGNDFIIIDQRRGEKTLSPETIIHLSDRRFGIGCDQFIHIKPPRHPDADVFLDMYNSDGSMQEACGNCTPCVAFLIMNESGKETCIVETVAGLLYCVRIERNLIQADMGPARISWKDIPLTAERDTLHLGLEVGDGAMLADPVAVGMGNRHCVFFVDDIGAIELEKIGPVFEHHPLFPNRTNVEIAQILSPDKIRMRVWERGAGITLACGSGACATLVAAARRGLTGRRAEIAMDGGSLFLEWRESDNHVLMTGPVSYVFDGVLKGL